MSLLSTALSQNTINFTQSAIGDNAAASELLTLLGYTNRFLTTDFIPSIGAAAATGNVASESLGVVNRTLLTLSAVGVSVTDALAYGGTKLYDFPEGRILILGVTSSLQWAVTSDRTATINNNASLTWGLGSATASNATLATTMVDLIPKTTKVLAAATTALNTISTAALAASAQFDGTGTAMDAYLNAAFETGGDIDADGTLTATGTIRITWINLGDY
jgi:hypothetical protein